MMTWENRWHPLLERWVTVTSHRGSRPWSGGRVTAAPDAPRFDPTCYLCPGGERISGIKNAVYTDCFVFDNDHPAFKASAPAPVPAPGIYQNARAEGLCRVLCYTPDHAGRLSGLSEDQFKAVVHCWRDQTDGLMAAAGYEHVFIFENNGEVVGVSNPHPHCQIYATPFVFHTVAQEIQAVARYRQADADNLFDAIIRSEQADGRRILVETDDCLAFVPYFAQLPYETVIVPKGSWQRLPEMPASVLDDLALVMRAVLKMQDHLWPTPQSYILAVHQAPKSLSVDHDYRCYIRLQPMLRGPGLQKYLAGVETGGGQFLNDGAPEEKAAELRAAGLLVPKES
ncbi:MAG: galactose-1-phosphate uridylyltransferase [Gammaproteobacteria bacterium]|jgi:UDPglucose--hexose-1-phosphate uridylyltransferase|nr:galactose-1-phosphate uridylyltransferase [Gammaproteobacteria bacterium]MBT5463237.1 galactose-1-phosphate uridylyltransferase [Gammaproteobacteria bacterium]